MSLNEHKKIIIYFYLMPKEYPKNSIYSNNFVKIWSLLNFFLTSLETFSSQQTVKVLYQLLAGLQRGLHSPGHLILLSQPPQFCSLSFVDISRNADTDLCGG